MIKVAQLIKNSIREIEQKLVEAGYKPPFKFRKISIAPWDVEHRELNEIERGEFRDRSGDICIVRLDLQLRSKDGKEIPIGEYYMMNKAGEDTVLQKRDSDLSFYVDDNILQDTFDRGKAVFFR